MQIAHKFNKMWTHIHHTQLVMYNGMEKCNSRLDIIPSKMNLYFIVVSMSKPTLASQIANFFCNMQLCTVYEQSYISTEQDAACNSEVFRWSENAITSEMSRRESWSVSWSATIYCMGGSSCVNQPGYLQNVASGRLNPSG